MNILPFTYDFQEMIPANIVNDGVWLSYSFWSKFCPHFENKINITFFVKNFTKEPCSKFAITLYLCYE